MRRSFVAALALPAAAFAQSAPSTKPVKPVNDQDKVVCRSFTEIGSLVAQRKECKTKREWSAERDETQHRIGECVNSGSATGAHC